jgi:hypothetical protein
MRSPAEREAVIADNIELFTARLTLRAWGWKNIDGWQREVLRCKDRYIHITASRQSGKSSIMACKVFHTLLTEPDALVLIVAEQRQSNEDMRKVKELARAYDKILREKYSNELTLTPVSENITSLELPNGARCIALPGNEKVRGYSKPRIVWMDEDAFLEDEVFIGIDPMLEVSPDSQLVLSSTPNGTRGHFYHESKNARYRKFRVTWRDCPRISPESIEAKRLTIGEAYVKQEFECEYIDELTSLFDEASLHASMDESEAVFAEDMKAIEQAIRGEAELI